MEKNIRIQLRYKLRFFLSLLMPIVGVFLPLIIMGEIFTLTDNFGPWNGSNYIVYQFAAYMMFLLYGVITRIQGGIAQEKGLNTLTLLLIAPFRRINLFISIVFSHLLLISIPFIGFFIWCYILFPVSIFTVFFIFLVFLAVTMIFTGIGLFFAILTIVREQIISIFNVGLTILLMFSCFSLPFEFFPEFYQNIALINPFYYIFNIVRYIWIDDNIIISLTSNMITFIVVILLGIISPLLGYKMFNYYYNKYGINIF